MRLKLDKIRYKNFLECTTISSSTILSAIKRLCFIIYDTITIWSGRMCMTLFLWPFISEMESKTLNMLSFWNTSKLSRKDQSQNKRINKVHSKSLLNLKSKKIYGSSNLGRTQTEGKGYRYLTNCMNWITFWKRRINTKTGNPWLTLFKSIFRDLYFTKTENLISGIIFYWPGCGVKWGPTFLAKGISGLHHTSSI